MKINQLKAGALLSYAQMFLQLVINLIYTPLMLRLLGQSEYGLYNTVSSTIAMLSVLNLGFNSSYIRFYSQYKGENNRIAIAKLNGLFLIIFSIIAIIAIFCGVFLSFNLDLVFADGLTVTEYHTARILMLLLTANLAVSFFMGVFSHIISAHERYVFLKLLGVLKTVLSPLVTLPLLLMGYKSIAMVITTVCISLFTDIIYFVYARKILHVEFVFHGFEKGIFRSLLIFTSFIAINMIVDQINSNMGKFLLGRYRGTTTVAIYSVGYTLYQCYMMFSTAISGVFSPRIHRIVNSTRDNLEEQRLQLTALFTKVGRVQFIILGLVASGLIFLGKPFISLWAGKGYTDSYYVVILLILSSSIALIQNLGIEIQRAQNRHHFRSIAYIIMAVVNLIITIELCQKYGAIGTAAGTAISLVLANGIVMNIYYHKRCNINIIFFWKNILRLSLGIVIPFICGIIINRVLDLTSVCFLAIGIVVYIVIYCISMYVVGMNAYEKSLVNKPLQLLKNKVGKC